LDALEVTASSQNALRKDGSEEKMKPSKRMAKRRDKGAEADRQRRGRRDVMRLLLAFD
jgi:hypothetical protein